MASMDKTELSTKMIAILKELIKNSASTDHHPDMCSRTTECDDAHESGEECSYCPTGTCPDCECGVAVTEEIIQRAMGLVKEAEGHADSEG
jgi:hypothetical protein